MAAHRKFTFDDPEDSYWNANGPLASSLFDDIPSTSNAAAARAALEDLFESQVRFTNDDASSTTESEKRTENGREIADVNTGDGYNIRKSVATDSRQRTLSATATVEQGNYGLQLQTSYSTAGRDLFDVSQGFSNKSAASIISEGSVGSFSNESTTQLDYSRLKSEHRKLQRHLEQVRHERFRAADPEMTIRRLLKGEPITLDLYRSKKQKLELLDSAIDSFDGNAVIAVVLFLRRSLSESIFREILLRKPVAANHYLAYLKEIQNYDQLAVTLFSLGRNDEAAMVEFSVACQKRSAEQKVQSLKKCLVSGFSEPSLAPQAKLVNEYIDLLERQIPIEAADDLTAKSSKDDVFTKFPKSASLVGQPVLTTLYYCCLYHYDLPLNAFASPLSIREVFQLSDKQFAWMAVSALSRLKRWTDVERVLTSKKLLGGSRIVCPFSWHHFFRIISVDGVPPKEVLCKLLRAVSDISERKQLAEQFIDANEVVVECLVAQKDRLGLSALLAKLTPHTNEAYKAMSALSNTAHKWKN